MTYVLLIAALGGDPSDPQHRATLARLCAWTTRGDIDTLFPTALGTVRSPSNVQRSLRETLGRVGEYEWVTTHTFRKTVARGWTRQG